VKCHIDVGMLAVHRDVLRKLMTIITSKSKVNPMDICKATLNTSCIFQSAEIWQHTVLPANKPYLPLLPSRKASPPFGWYSFYRPMEGRRLSGPGWLVTYRNKVSAQEVEPGHG